MKFDKLYISYLQRIVENANTPDPIKDDAASQINNALSLLDKIDPAVLQKTGLDKQKKRLTDEVTKATTEALQKLHTVMKSTFSKGQPSSTQKNVTSTSNQPSPIF